MAFWNNPKNKDKNIENPDPLNKNNRDAWTREKEHDISDDLMIEEDSAVSDASADVYTASSYRNDISPDMSENHINSNSPRKHAKDTLLEDLPTELNRLRREIGIISSKIDNLTELFSNSSKPDSSGMDSDKRILERLDMMTEQQQLIENQQSIIKRQHDAMLKYNDDVIYKTQKGLIMEMIDIADHVRMVMENKRIDESYDLMEGLREIEEGIEASLSNNSVKRYSETAEDDSVFNRKRQSSMGNEVTSLPEKDGHFKSVAPGYEWTMPYLVVNSEVKLSKILEENRMPQTFSFVIRPEEVMKLKYKAPEVSEVSEATETSEEIHNSESEDTTSEDTISKKE